MGIQPEVATYLRTLPLAPGFSVCELGDQGMCGPTKRLAKDWYAEWGCGRYVSLDGNGRGTFALDLNQPLPDSLRPLTESFDLVTDFGTGEHIFDQAQVWRTLHALVKPGGYIAFDRPAQGYAKHGFYLTTDCVFRDLAAANDYAIVWLASMPMPRGILTRGVYRRPQTSTPFRVPQQGRYRSDLVVA